jgi:hypothetical protein
VPNAKQILQVYPTYDDFVKAIATKMRQIEDNEHYQLIERDGLEGLKKCWYMLPETSLLDTAIGMLECSLRIYQAHLDQHSIIVEDTLLEGPSSNSFVVTTLHYKCPVEHFELLLPEAFVVNDDLV